MAATHHGLNDSTLQTLASKAISAKQYAYCPYSNFRVGACILIGNSSTSALTPGNENEDATFLTGANVEIASTPVGICAERCALAPLVASYRRPAMPQIKAIAISTDISPPASPCGMCRQFIREFCEPDTPIFMYDKDDNWEKYEVKTIGELLPMSFGPNDLNRNRDAASTKFG